MLSRSVRSLARAVPRSVSRISSGSSRWTSPLRLSPRSEASCVIGVRAAVMPFSTTARRPDVLEELKLKLESEIEIEQDMEKTNKSNASEFKEYLGGVWELHEQAGSQEIKLTRKYNDEHIEVVLAVSSIEQRSIEAAEDEAYEDEEFDEPDASAQSGGANTKGAINQGRIKDGNVRVAPEDKIAPSDRELNDEEGEFADEDGQQSSYPVRLAIKVTRDGKPGVLEIDASAANGYVDISNVSHWPSQDLTSGTADAEQKQMTLYGGPTFETLDQDLQSLMQQYLEERGIDVELVLRLPDIVDWKEEKEYLKWLHDVKDFLS